MVGPIARGTVRTTLVLGLRLSVQAGTLLIVARMLGAQQFGVFAGIAALAVALGALSTFGTHLVLLGEVSKQPALRSDVLCFAVPTTLTCGSALLALYILVVTLGLPEAGVPLAVLVAIGSAEILLQPLFSLPVFEHLALGRTARSQLLQTLPLALRLVAAAAILALDFTHPLETYAWGYLFASLIALFVATTTMPAAWPRPGAWRLARWSELREAAGYAALNITAAGPAELDKTLASKLLPLSIAGVYAAGARVIGAATSPVIAMMLSALPRLFREGQEQTQRLMHLLQWVFGAAFAYSIVLAMALYFCAPVFVRLFGDEFDDLDEMIRWLCLSVPAMSLRVVAGSVLMALGKPWMRVAFEASGLLILVLVASVLASRLGAVSMPVALACSEWGMVFIGLTLTVISLRNQSAKNRV